MQLACVEEMPQRQVVLLELGFEPVHEVPVAGARDIAGRLTKEVLIVEGLVAWHQKLVVVPEAIRDHFCVF